MERRSFGLQWRVALLSGCMLFFWWGYQRGWLAEGQHLRQVAWVSVMARLLLFRSPSCQKTLNNTVYYTYMMMITDRK